MNNNLFGVVLLFLAMAVVSRLMALPQIHRLNKQLVKIRKSGPVSSVGLAVTGRGTALMYWLPMRKGILSAVIRQAGILCFQDFGRIMNLGREITVKL